MQLVLSNNRVLAHGENFISMGGTVINTETNKVYQNATVAECDGCPSDIDTVGYEYHAGEFVPCAPYGKGNGNIAVVCNNDCKAIKDSGIPLEHTFTSSYMAFVGSVNTDTLDAAFGKNNEDSILGIGRQMAMYAWFKGTDKSTNLFPNLIEMSRLKDMTVEAFEELATNSYTLSLVKSSPFALDKNFVMYEHVDGGGYGTSTETFTITVTEEDLKRPFYFYYFLSCYHVKSKLTLSIGTKTYSITGAQGGDRISDSFSGMKEWHELGITTSGEYTVTCTQEYLNMVGNNPKLDMDFTILKMKG